MEKVAEGFKGEKAIVTPYNIRNLQRENNITKQLFVSHIGYYPHAENHFSRRPCKLHKSEAEWINPV